MRWPRVPELLKAVAGRASERPRVLTHTLTFTCNARCMMCDSWKLPGKDDLSLDEIARIYTQLPRMDLVRLTGGEPTARRDLPQIVDLAERELQPHLLHITTNGFLVDRLVELCEHRRGRTPLFLMVSIDGVGPTHDEIRGHPKAYSSALEALRALAPHRRRLRLQLAVNQTVLDERGMREYPALHEALRELEIDHQVVMAYQESATYSVERELDLAPEDGEFQAWADFEPRALEEFFDRVDRDLQQLPIPSRAAKRYYLRGIRNRMLEARADPSPPCAALGQHLRLFPNGDVPTCQFNTKIVGNLRRQSFSELWASALRREQRAWVRRCAGCWAECEVLPSATYSGELARATLGEALGRRRTAPASTPRPRRYDPAVPPST